MLFISVSKMSRKQFVCEEEFTCCCAREGTAHCAGCFFPAGDAAFSSDAFSRSAACLCLFPAVCMASELLSGHSTLQREHVNLHGRAFARAVSADKASSDCAPPLQA